MAAPRILGGSTPALAASVVVFLATFFALRASSGFLVVERAAPTLRVVAARLDLHPAVALAVCEQASGDAAAWEGRLAAFAALAQELGEPLAAVALAGEEGRARAALRAAGDDPGAAWAAVRREPFALAGVRFLNMRDRYADRESGRLRD